MVEKAEFMWPWTATDFVLIRPYGQIAYEVLVFTHLWGCIQLIFIERLPIKLDNIYKRIVLLNPTT